MIWRAPVAVLALAGCGAYARPPEDPHAYASAARALGARVVGDRCPLGVADLTARTIAAWGEDPRRYSAEWACVAIVDDLARDSMGSCAPPPDAVFAARGPYARRVTGDVFYVGLDPREYAYDLVAGPAGGGSPVDVEVRVELTGPLAREPARVRAMQRKMDLAAAFWTRYAPGGGARFRFLAVTDDGASPHFQVRLAPGEPRSPFDVTWGEDWSWHLLAHEIGHMMGLDDEYGQVKKTVGHAIGEEPTWTVDPIDKIRWFNCDPHSIMCDSKGEASTPLPYHYYVILRRRFCRVTEPEETLFAP